MGNKMKKVSVIVPVYNVEAYIARCLDSLVNQTLNDIEIVVVNDGTKDNSQAIIDEYVKKYPKKVFSYIKENGGLSSARNYGIKKAHGEYIGFVDSDDYVDTDLYEKMYNEGKKEKAEIVGCGVRYIYKDKIAGRELDSKLFNKSVVESPEILIRLKSYAPNKIYKRELWDEFEFPKQYFEDSAVIYNVLLKANKIACIYDSFYYYNRLNETAITRIADDRAYDIFKSCDSILDYYKKNNCYEQTKEVVDEVCIGHIRFRIITYIRCNDTIKLRKYIDDSIKYLDEKIPDWRKNRSNKLSTKLTMKDNLYRLIFRNRGAYNIYIGIHQLKHKLTKK